MDEFARSAVDFSKRIVKLEVQCKRLKEENNNLKQEVMEAKGKTDEMKEKYAKVRDKFVKRKEKFDSEERKWREEEERLTEIGWQLEREKKKIENNLRASAAEALRCVARKLREVEAEAEVMKSLMEEKDAKIISLLAKNESLERCRSRLEIDFEAKMATRCKVEEEKILELTQKIQVLEGEKGQLEAEFCKVKEDNRSKEEKICVLERVKEAEKRAIEDEGKKKVSELHHRIEVLEREKKQVEDKFSLFVEKSEEITRIVNQRPATIVAKMTLEAESKKYVLELIRRIEVLEREKTELEAEVSQTKTGKKSEEIVSILKEKHKEISNLVFKSDILESRKHRLEAQNREGDERIKVLVKEKECLVGTKKKMEIEMNSCVVNSKEDVELTQSMHPDASNIDITSTTTTQNEGPEYVVLSDTEPKESSNSGLQSRGLLGLKISERKVEGLGCSLANEAGTKCCKLDGLTECKTTQHTLEAQTKEKDERIKMLVQEKESLVGKTKKIENEMNRCAVNSKEDVELSQPVHPDASNVDGTSASTTQNGVSSPSPSPSTSSPYEKMEVETNSCVVMSKDDVELPQSVHLDASNADIISTPTTQNEGPEHIDLSDAEPKESSGLLGSKITKRKVELLGCSVANQAQTKCCKLDGLMKRKTLQHRLEAQKEQEERIKMLVQEKRIKMLVQEKEHLVGGKKTKMENEMSRYGVSFKKDVELPQPVHPDACNVDSTSTPTTQNRVSSPSPATSTSSRYENQKRRDWNSFGKYLKNHKPDLAPSSCSGHHVHEYLLYLDQFGKTKVHVPDCPFYGHPNPPDPCPCPIRQGWGSLDALTGRLRAAFEENGGKPEDNPFGTLIVRRYLLEVKNSQSKARGVSYLKKRKNPRKAANSHMPLAPPPASGTC